LDTQATLRKLAALRQKSYCDVIVRVAAAEHD
jgi:hypothetical protein